MTDSAYGAQVHAQLRAAQTALADARSWARHGYEIGQRHCGWTDHGAAPAWLTEGWPARIDTCGHLTALGQAERRVEELSAGCGQLSWAVNLQRERAEQAEAELAQWRAAAEIPLLPTLERERDDARQQLAMAEARIAAVRVLHTTELGNEFGGLECSTCREVWPCSTIAALDGPAKQSAGPPQLSPASIAAPEPVQPPTWAAMAELAQRARVEYLADQGRLEEWIYQQATAAGLEVHWDTDRVEEVAGHPDAISRMRELMVVAAAPVDALGRIGSLTGLPFVADPALPPRVIHLRPHPRAAGGPS